MTNQINAYTDERNPNPGRYIEAEAAHEPITAAECDHCHRVTVCRYAYCIRFCSAAPKATYTPTAADLALVADEQMDRQAQADLRELAHA